MNKTNDIRLLIDRFFDGTTTLDEEQRLYHYFDSDGVADDLRPLRDVFLGLAAIQQTDVQPSAHAKYVPLVRRVIMAAAACLATAVIVTATVGTSRQDECVAYVYGQRVTDRAIVLREMNRTMQTVVGEATVPSVEEQLREVFM